MEFLCFFSIVVVFICIKMCKNVIGDTKRSYLDIVSKLILLFVLIAALALFRLGGLRERIYG